MMAAIKELLANVILRLNRLALAPDGPLKPMAPATKELFHTIVRHLKGILTAFDDWVRKH